MKIAWASPFTLRSAIGRVSADVTRALSSAGHDVDLIATEAEAIQAEVTHVTHAPVRSWRKLDQAQLAAYDAVVVNVGDNFLFHEGIFALTDMASCVGVFHDFYLYNLFSGWLTQQPAGRHDQEVLATYGSERAAIALAARLGQATLADIAREIPMTEWFGRRCGAALAHSPFYLDRLRESCPGPLSVAALPITSRGVRPPPSERDSVTTLLTVGVMNPNKCVDRVIEAIAGSEILKSSVRYQLAGPIGTEERHRLSGLAQRLGYTRLEIFGEVDDEALAQRLEDSDIISCLRAPVLEGASGSAVEALLAGRPTLVADAGFYQDLPSDLVIKVGPTVEVQEVRAALERVMSDLPAYRQKGLDAKAWARQTFTLNAYLDQLVPLLTAETAARPVLNLGRRWGRALKGLGLTPQDPIIKELAGHLSPFLTLEN